MRRKRDDKPTQKPRKRVRRHADTNVVDNKQRETDIMLVRAWDLNRRTACDAFLTWAIGECLVAMTPGVSEVVHQMLLDTGHDFLRQWFARIADPSVSAILKQGPENIDTRSLLKTDKTLCRCRFLLKTLDDYDDSDEGFAYVAHPYAVFESGLLALAEAIFETIQVVDLSRDPDSGWWYTPSRAWSNANRRCKRVKNEFAFKLAVLAGNVRHRYEKDLLIPLMKLRIQPFLPVTALLSLVCGYVLDSDENERIRARARQIVVDANAQAYVHEYTLSELSQSVCAHRVDLIDRALDHVHAWLSTLFTAWDNASLNETKLSMDVDEIDVQRQDEHALRVLRTWMNAQAAEFEPLRLCLRETIHSGQWSLVLKMICWKAYPFVFRSPEIRSIITRLYVCGPNSDSSPDDLMSDITYDSCNFFGAEIPPDSDDEAHDVDGGNDPVHAVDDKHEDVQSARVVFEDVEMKLAHPNANVKGIGEVVDGLLSWDTERRNQILALLKMTQNKLATHSVKLVRRKLADTLLETACDVVDKWFRHYLIDPEIASVLDNNRPARGQDSKSLLPVSNNLRRWMHDELSEYRSNHPDATFHWCIHPWVGVGGSKIEDVIYQTLTGVRYQVGSDKLSDLQREFTGRWIKLMGTLRTRYEKEVWMPFLQRRIQSFIRTSDVAKVVCEYTVCPEFNAERRDMALRWFHELMESGGDWPPNKEYYMRVHPDDVHLAIERIHDWISGLLERWDAAHLQKDDDSKAMATLRSWIDARSEQTDQLRLHAQSDVASEWWEDVLDSRYEQSYPWVRRHSDIRRVLTQAFHLGQPTNLHVVFNAIGTVFLDTGGHDIEAADGSFDVIDYLVNRGYPLVMLSHGQRELEMKEMLSKHQHHIRFLDVKDAGHTEMFEWLKERLDLQSKDVVYIDVDEENIDEAKSVGIKTVLVNDEQGLSENLMSAAGL